MGKDLNECTKRMNKQGVGGASYQGDGAAHPPRMGAENQKKVCTYHSWGQWKKD